MKVRKSKYENFRTYSSLYFKKQTNKQTNKLKTNTLKVLYFLSLLFPT